MWKGPLQKGSNIPRGLLVGLEAMFANGCNSENLGVKQNLCGNFQDINIQGEGKTWQAGPPNSSGQGFRSWPRFQVKEPGADEAKVHPEVLMAPETASAADAILLVK